MYEKRIQQIYIEAGVGFISDFLHGATVKPRARRELR